MKVWYGWGMDDTPEGTPPKTDRELQEEAMQRLAVSLTLPAALPHPGDLPDAPAKYRHGSALLRTLATRFEDGPDCTGAVIRGSTTRITRADNDDETVLDMSVHATLTAVLRTPRFERLRTMIPFTRTPKPRLDHFQTSVSLYDTDCDPLTAHQQLAHLHDAREVTLEIWEPLLSPAGSPQWMHVSLPRLTHCRWGMWEMEIDSGGTTFTFLQGRTTPTHTGAPQHWMTLTGKGPA